MPLISQTTIDKIVDYQLSDALKSFVTLKKEGANLKGISPFNEEDQTPSFLVSDAKGVWKCFSTGKGGKNLISFLMAKDNLDFFAATTKAAKELNIVIEYEEETKEAKEKREHTDVLKSISQKANATYQKNFKSLQENHWAKKYMLETRNFTPEILELFDVGFAHIDSRLTPIIKNDGILTDALELGLVKQDQKIETSHYDFFRDRVIFPIYNHRTECVGFGGRKNPEDANEKNVKYLNSTESKIYHKRDILFGYNLAKHQIKFFGYAILVEGYTDVMRMHQVGFDNTVATCGTALTVNHIKELKKITDKVVIFRDGDKAGQNAVLRDMELLLQNDMIVELVVPENKEDDPDSIGQRLGEKSVDYITALMEDAILYQIKAKFNTLMLDINTERKEVISALEKEKSVLVSEISDLTKTRTETKENHLKIDLKQQIDEKKSALKICEKDLRLPKLIMPPANKKAFVNFIGDTLSEISDQMVKEQYQKEVVSRFEDVSAKELNEVLKSIDEAKKPKKVIYLADEDYNLPRGVTCTIDEVIEDIKKYGCFQSNNRIWVTTGEDSSNFKHISNFEFEVIQHMRSKDQPMKLFRMKNLHNYETIDHANSELFNTVNGFKSIITRHGNFHYTASSVQHDQLLLYLFDKMRNGKIIHSLGWQSQKFWVWNNEVLFPYENRIEKINDQGIIDHGKESFYIPSANVIYAEDDGEYKMQKSFKTTIYDGEDYNDLLRRFIDVHKKEAMTALLFCIASLHQDIVVKHTHAFPLFFMYGDAGSGKDNIAYFMQSFFGVPQTKIPLETEGATFTAMIRKLAQFKNAVVHYSEFTRAKPLGEALVKSIWDRTGKEIGNVTSKINTEEVPVNSAALMTGNQFPTSKAALSRLIFCEMNKSEFTPKEVENYEDLKEKINTGFSAYANQFILDRPRFEELFLKEYNMQKKNVAKLFKDKQVMSRIIENYTVLYATYTLYCDKTYFPFSKIDLENYIIESVQNIERKINGASPFIKFWECFVACMKTYDEIKLFRDFKVDGNKIYIQPTNCFIAIQQKWFKLYDKDIIPGKTDMFRHLKEDTSSLGKDGNFRISNNSKVNGTSVMIFDMNKLANQKDIIYGYELQLNHNTLYAKKDENAEEDTPF